MRASGESSWELLQNVYPPGADREQPIPIGLALSRELLGGTGACRVHGGGFAGTILTVAPEDRADFYRRGMERVFGEGSVRELTIRRYGMISSRLPV
jgi:galactokinase